MKRGSTLSFRALRMSLFVVVFFKQPPTARYFWLTKVFYSKSFHITAYLKAPVLPKQNLQQSFSYIETIALTVIILR